MKATGIILIVAGLLLSIFTAVSYFTNEKVAKIGPLEIDKEKKHTINWSPIVGIALVGAGCVCLFQGNKKAA